MAGLVPVIPIIDAQCPPDRDRRDKPGDDEPAATRFAPHRNHDFLAAGTGTPAILTLNEPRLVRVQK